ncbi:MAG: hypothetical protein DMG01_28635 [Acidobacteria bacterium]|nr:MAG: hypothetical protein DMG01_28635 [Acidobacteriota bacterium]
MIVDYDPLWPLDFEAERRRIAAALGDLAVRIEHNGSCRIVVEQEHVLGHLRLRCWM